MTASPFFDELKDWSERKLTLISKYTDAMSRILHDVYYIDGFAGRGWYGKDGEAPTPGSPLRAAQLARKLQEDQRNYSLRCINIESDSGTYEQLCNATQAYADLATNLFGPFADNTDRLLQIVQEKAVLCFLDPFGIDGMDMSAIERIICRPRGITDLWVRFDAGEARRRDGYYASDEPGAEKQFEILCRVYGVGDRNVLHNALAAPTAEERMLAALRFYMRQLSSVYGRHKGDSYVGAYHIRSIAGDSKYWLVAATAHPKGFVLISDLIYGAEENYQTEAEWYRQNQTGQLSMFSTLDPSKDDIFDEKVRAVEFQILDECQGKTLDRLEIHATVLKKGLFGKIKKPHVTKALKHICETGMATSSSQKFSDDNTIFGFR